MRRQYELSKAAYGRRAAAISKIPNFWPLVLEQAPMEIDQFVQPQDSRIFAESLIDLQVTRPELENDGTGHPRSLHIRFEFRPNDDFENTVLEKTFWHRRTRDGTTGLVSEPVKIHWKKGKDLTSGLTDMAYALFEARKKAGDMTATGLPEYTALQKKVQSWNGMNTSFFTWFGWVSGHRWVSAEESEKAAKEYALQKEKRKAGSSSETQEDEQAEQMAEEEDKLDDEAVEVHEAGEELAVAFAEDLWPNAIKFFTQAQEDENMEDMSDAGFEDDDGLDDDDEQPVDIKALVQEKGKGGSSNTAGAPPTKKRKT